MDIRNQQEHNLQRHHHCLAQETVTVQGKKILVCYQMQSKMVRHCVITVGDQVKSINAILDVET